MADTGADRVDAPRSRADELDDFGDRLYTLAMRITGQADDAAVVIDDALQMAAVKAAMFPDSAELASWLYLNVAHMAYQKRSQRIPDVKRIALDDVLPARLYPGRHFAPMVDWSEEIDPPNRQHGWREALLAALDALPGDERTAIILHDVEGASKPDIAAVLGVDVRTVASHVHRARLFLRMRLSEHFIDPMPLRRD